MQGLREIKRALKIYKRKRSIRKKIGVVKREEILKITFKSRLCLFDTSNVQ